jgi:potassium-transporting ATPase potassium-binding subunit
MTLNGWLQITVYFLAILAVTKPLGSYMTRVFARERTWLDPLLRPIERLIYRLTGVDEKHDMCWTEYALALVLFSLVSMIVLYLMQRLQAVLPFNPQALDAVAPDLSFNTAASFTTNTNWQSYVPETTMSYLTQMAVLAHRFTVTRYPQMQAHDVSVAIDPEAVTRVARLTRRELQPAGGFWRHQAERMLAAYLWSEGTVPAPNQLRVTDIARAELDVAARWEAT